MIHALQGVVEVSEIESIVEQLPAPLATPVQEASPVQANLDLVLRAEGKRWDDPIMAIDVHKEPLAWAVATPEGIEDEAMTENNTGGIGTVIAACRNHGVKMVAMESTSEYWLLPYWLLTEAGIPVLVANPLQVKAVMGVKTDKLDARRIAFALRDGRLRPSVACTREEYALRKDMRQLVEQVEYATQCEQRIQQIFHKADVPDLVGNAMNSQRGRSILVSVTGCRTRDELLGVVTAEYSMYKGRITDPVELEIVTDTYWDFSNRVRANGDMERLAMELDSFLAHEDKALVLERNGIMYAKQHPAFLQDLKYLLTFEGIGRRTALPILAELVNIRYFPTAAKLAKWTGLVPGVYQSGHRKRANGKIYKGGNKYLRRAVWLVAQRCFGMRENIIKQFIQHLIRDKHKSKMVAITEGAHKVLTIIHAMLTRQEPFTVIANEEVIKRQERNTKRKWSEVERMMMGLAEEEIVPRLVPRLKARLEACTNMERIVAELAASLLGNIDADQIVSEPGGG